VTLCDFPLQFPVPFSASKGTIGKTNGHIDILGRRPGGVLSVWELKKPDLCGSAPRQAYIYALQIYFMIYDPHMGKKWLELFGFGRESQTVRIEIVLGLSNSQNGKAMAGITKIRDEMKLDGIDSLFSWHIANYSIAHDMHTMSINKVP